MKKYRITKETHYRQIVYVIERQTWTGRWTSVWFERGFEQHFKYFDCLSRAEAKLTELTFVPSKEVIKEYPELTLNEKREKKLRKI